jgi:hypothetical protein
MQGKGNVRFTDLFSDTVRTHGVRWAATYYCKRGLSISEFLFWLKACKLG